MLLIPVAAAFAITSAQTQGVVRGSVVDAVAGTPIVTVTLTNEGTGVTARSDERGRFALDVEGDREDEWVISHPEYVSGHMRLRGAVAATRPPLVVRLVRRWDPSVDLGAAERALAAAEAMQREVGGTVWPGWELRGFASLAAHPLDLLLYSGYSNAVTRGGSAQCVVLRGASGCAAIWIDGSEAVDPRSLDDRFSADVAAIVIVRPETARPGRRSAPSGIVGLFFLEHRP